MEGFISEGSDDEVGGTPVRESGSGDDDRSMKLSYLKAYLSSSPVEAMASLDNTELDTLPAAALDAMYHSASVVSPAIDRRFRPFQPQPQFSAVSPLSS
jgi:hypothetical protein